MDKRILVVGLGNSAADVTVELSQRVFRNQVTLSTRSSAWIVPEADVRQGRGHELPDQPAHPDVLAAQGRAVGPEAHGVRPDALRPAGAQPQVLRGAPDPVRRAAAAAQVRRRHREGQRRAARRRDRALRGRHLRRLRRDHLRDRLQPDVPVLRPRVPRRAGQPDRPLPADHQARRRRPAVRRLRAVDPDALPVRGVPGPAHRGVRDRRVRPALRGRDARGDPQGRREVHGPHARPAPAHPPARLLRLRAPDADQGAAAGAGPGAGAGQQRRRSAHDRRTGRPGRARRPAPYGAPRGARPPPAPGRPGPAQPRLDQHRRHLAAAPASRARRSTSTSTTRPPPSPP